MAYRILSVRSADSEPSVWYPRLSDELRIVPEASSERLGQPYFVQGMRVLRRAPGRPDLEKLHGAFGVEAELWVTSYRLVVRCKHYDKVKWDGSNAIGAAIWGSGMEMTSHLASKAYHRLKERGNAMVGHIYFHWIHSIAYTPQQGRKHPPALRFELEYQPPNSQATEALYLAVQFARDFDAKALMKRILASTATWYLREAGTIHPNSKATLEQMAAPGYRIAEPSRGQEIQVKLPVWGVASGRGVVLPG